LVQLSPTPGPASNRPCGQPSRTRDLQLSSSALPCGAADRLASGLRLQPPLRPCLEPALRLALPGPTSESHRLPLPSGAALGSASSLRLQPLLRPCLVFGLQLALRRTLQASAYDFSSSACSPAAAAAGLAPNPPGLAFRLSLRSRLAPFASAQPSSRLPACALTPARAFVSCLPSSQPSGRLSQVSGSRLAPRSVVSPLAMPSSWNLRLLARTLRPVSLVFAQPLESSLRLAPSISTPRHRSRGLRRSSLRLPCGCASRLGQLLRPGPPGSRSSGLAPFLIRPATEPHPRSACASCFFRPALWSCLGVPLPLNPGLRLHSVSGSSVPSWFLRTSSSGAFQIALPLRACALCFRSTLRPAFSRNSADRNVAVALTCTLLCY
jgi:hypothetical protein